MAITTISRIETTGCSEDAAILMPLLVGTDISEIDAVNEAETEAQQTLTGDADTATTSAATLASSFIPTLPDNAPLLLSMSSNAPTTGSDVGSAGTPGTPGTPDQGCFSCLGTVTPGYIQKKKLPARTPSTSEILEIERKLFGPMEEAAASTEGETGSSVALDVYASGAESPELATTSAAVVKRADTSKVVLVNASKQVAGTRKKDIMSFLIRDTVAEGLVEISRIVSTYFQNVNKTDVLVGIFALYMHYSANPFPAGTVVTNKAFVRDAVMGMRYSSGAFGWKLAALFPDNSNFASVYRAAKIIKGFSLGDADNVTVFSKHTGIPGEDLVAWQWTSSAYNPGHYVAVDKARSTIVVSIRGSYHVVDALTDFTGSCKPLEIDGVKGWTHRGFWRSSLCKYGQLAPIVSKLVEQLPTYRVLVVGTSLGGAVAQLLALCLLLGPHHLTAQHNLTPCLTA
eukprot:TRINITY_DN5642_c0_g1_i2.p1 TRINITY_DN5642_c0_g1~~TRINITY_DN5642_c0_g1_i2.p1  ORF type:complete len:532 (-),score=82.56 TRINITY_DN5642_c0_g1_i2:682-2052(-)